MPPVSRIKQFLLVLIVFTLAMWGLTLHQAAAQSGSPEPKNKAQRSHESQIGIVPEIAKRSSYIGPLSADTKLQMIISFELDDEAGLLQLIDELYDPASPRYHQWLKPEEFGEKFGRSKAEFDQAIEWLKANHFKVETAWPNNLSISFSGTVDVIERAFHIEMGRFHNPGNDHIFYSNRQDPILPPEIESITSSLIGLNDAFESRVGVKTRPSGDSGRQPQKKTVNPLIGPQGKTPDGQSYLNPAELAPELQDKTSDGRFFLSPTDLAVAYNYKPLADAGFRGQGQRVGIVIHSNITEADIALYRETYKLGPANVQRIFTPPYSDPGVNSVGDADVECALDVASISAVAPMAEIDLILIPNLKVESRRAAELYIVNTLGTPVVTESFSECEGATFDMAEQMLMRQAESEGIAFFVSSGDEGIECHSGEDARGLGAAGCPACYDGVTSVGGTQIDGNYNANGNLVSITAEKVWNDFPGVRFNCAGQTTGGGASGGGYSQKVPRPNYQTLASGFVGGVPIVAGRAIPDVAALAGNPVTPIALEKKISYLIRGTSQSSPLWAGMMALINQFNGSVQGAPNRELYRLGTNQYRNGGPAVFRDITVGNNSTGSRSSCEPIGVTGVPAAFGYDAATGWGVPDLNALARNFGVALLNSGVPQSSTITTPVVNFGYLGLAQYAIQVPSGATQLKIDLIGDQNVDLFARFGQRVGLVQGNPVYDFISTSTSHTESITITPTSSPALQAGTYFIAIVNFGPSTTTFTVTATVTAPISDPTTLLSGVPLSGGIAAPGPGLCLLAAPQYLINIPSGASQIFAELRAPSQVTLFARFGQRVAVVSGAPVFDRSVAADKGAAVLQFNGSEVRAGPCFFALGNCATVPIDFILTVTVLTGPVGGNNPPVILSLAGRLDGDVLTLTGTATDVDGDIVQAQSRSFDGFGALVSQTPIFNVAFGTTTTVNINIQVTNFNAFPTAMRGSLILTDSRGNHSAEIIADFSQPDPGGPTIANIPYNGAKMTIKGKGLVGNLSIEINGQVVAAGFNSNNKKAVVKGSPATLNVHVGPNRVRVRNGSLRSNLFILDF
jgi:subtilase family serine protease